MTIYQLPTPANYLYYNRYIKFINHFINNPNPKTIKIERHHIVPRSMGGTNDKDNLINLTPRQHLIAHWMLWKAYQTYQMTKAFSMMVVGPEWLGRSPTMISGRIYERVKLQARELYSGENHPYYNKKRPDHSAKMSGDGNPMYGVQLFGEDNGFFGRQHTDEYKRNASEAKRGKKLEEIVGKERAAELSKKRSDRCKGSGNSFFGKTHTEEFKKRMSELKIGIESPLKGSKQKEVYCVHCDRMIAGPTNYKRWHGDRCKHKP